MARSRKKRTIKATQRLRRVEPYAKPITFAAARKIIDHVPCPLLSTFPSASLTGRTFIFSSTAGSTSP